MYRLANLRTDRHLGRSALDVKSETSLNPDYMIRVRHYRPSIVFSDLDNRGNETSNAEWIDIVTRHRAGVARCYKRASPTVGSRQID